MKRKIIQYGNPTLEKTSLEVPLADIKTQEFQNLIQDLKDTLKAEEDHSAGISAPQIGVLKRIAICRRVDLEETKKQQKEKTEWEIMINPEITYSSPETDQMYEGCLSINKGNLFGMVQRPQNIVVKYFSPEGDQKTLQATGFLSHIVQHEIDHLNGVLFLKYIKDPTKLYTSDELDSLDE